MIITRKYDILPPTTAFLFVVGSYYKCIKEYCKYILRYVRMISQNKILEVDFNEKFQFLIGKVYEMGVIIQMSGGDSFQFLIGKVYRCR